MNIGHAESFGDHLAQLFFFFFALPSLGLRWSAHTAALTAMVVNLGAYATEIIRAGIESIPKGQIEAALALSLKRRKVFQYVILKPALRTVYPALTSQFTLTLDQPDVEVEFPTAILIKRLKL